MYEKIKNEVFSGLIELYDNKIVKHSQGNLSVIDRDRNIIAIKPSGIQYNELAVSDIVVTDLDGRVLEGNHKPSVDLPTHTVIYRNFSKINCFIHTHSHWATVFAQAGLKIPLIGTTHADEFLFDIPCTDYVEPTSGGNYELDVGLAIYEYFQNADYSCLSAILLKGHGAFVWGDSVIQAVNKAIVLEEIASLAWHTLLLNPSVSNIPDTIAQKHYYRKNGLNAYYGQRSQG